MTIQIAVPGLGGDYNETTTDQFAVPGIGGDYNETQSTGSTVWYPQPRSPNRVAPWVDAQPPYTRPAIWTTPTGYDLVSHNPGHLNGSRRGLISNRSPTKTRPGYSRHPRLGSQTGIPRSAQQTALRRGSIASHPIPGCRGSSRSPTQTGTPNPGQLTDLSRGSTASRRGSGSRPSPHRRTPERLHGFRGALT